MASNRKPYLGLGKSSKEFFDAPTRFLKEGNAKESQFEKPYLSSEYPSMQMDIPTPDWPSWKFDPTLRRRIPSEVAKIGTGPSCKYCDLHSWDIAGGRCADNAINVHADRYCSTQSASIFDENLVRQISRTQYFKKPGDEKYSRREVPSGTYVQQWGDVRLYVEAFVGEIVKAEPGWTDFMKPSIDVYVNPDIALHGLLATMIDSMGNVCYDVVEVNCETYICLPSSAFAFDTSSTPDTIAPGGNITGYVTGGCPPYTWSVDGVGYTLDGSVGLSSVLTSASGTCGTDYDAFSTVTVTDDNGDSVEFETRNTGGQWSANATPRQASTTCGSASLCNPTCYRAYTVGNNRWLCSPITRSRTDSCACTQSSSNWDSGWGGGTGPEPPLSPYSMWNTQHNGIPCPPTGISKCGDCYDVAAGTDLYRCYWREWIC